jgi:transposase
MFTLGGGAKIFLATGVTDLRRGFSLSTVIEHQLGFGQPLNGDVYVFINRRRDLVKLVWFSEGGRYVCAKRLETGTFFRWPEASEKMVSMTPAQLQLLLSGIDLTKTRARKWWRPATD